MNDVRDLVKVPVPAEEPRRLVPSTRASDAACRLRKHMDLGTKVVVRQASGPCLERRIDEAIVRSQLPTANLNVLIEMQIDVATPSDRLWLRLGWIAIAGATGRRTQQCDRPESRGASHFG
jgi:hypothetical protein